MPASEPATPSATLANLVLALLAPMFLWSTAGDLRLAYAAAAQTVNEYSITNRLSVFTVAKIIAFDIATLSSLSLSMYEDVSMLEALRLRGNANSLDRSGERSRLRLEQERRTGHAGDGSAAAAVAEAERMVREAKAWSHADAPATPNAGTAPAAKPAAVAAPALEMPATPAPAPRTSADRLQTVRADMNAPVAERSPPGATTWRRALAGPRWFGSRLWPWPPAIRLPPPRRPDPRWPRSEARPCSFL
jgi:hypothetical protein